MRVSPEIRQHKGVTCNGYDALDTSIMSSSTTTEDALLNSEVLKF